MAHVKGNVLVAAAQGALGGFVIEPLVAAMFVSAWQLLAAERGASHVETTY